MNFSVATDLFPLVTGILAAVCCGVLGNFLVLRKLSLMGDAISHSVLPGLVIAFLLTGSRSPLPMFLGAAAAGLVTVGLVELVKRFGRVDPGAAMGVVFSVMFALGVLLIEQNARGPDLAAQCVLYGQLETLWFTPQPGAALFSAETLSAVPRVSWTLLGMTVLALGFTALFFKELRIVAFDPGLATAQGIHAGFMHTLLMVMVAAATVASFEAVGSILVVAMLIVPAAIARLLTDRLGSQVVVSLAVAVLASVLGYALATVLPAAFGRDAVNIAGAIAVSLGGLLAVTVVASPRYGLIAKAWRVRGLAGSIARDDLLAGLYRAEERGERGVAAISLSHRAREAALAAQRDGLLHRDGPSVSLTPLGRTAASEVVRRHRLWETYLVDRAGLAPDHVHATAEWLEHTPIVPRPHATHDPHGKPIPETGRPDDRPPGG